MIPLFNLTSKSLIKITSGVLLKKFSRGLSLFLKSISPHFLILSVLLCLIYLPAISQTYMWHDDYWLQQQAIKENCRNTPEYAALTSVGRIIALRANSKASVPLPTGKQYLTPQNLENSSENFSVFSPNNHLPLSAIL